MFLSWCPCLRCNSYSILILRALRSRINSCVQDIPNRVVGYRDCYSQSYYPIYSTPTFWRGRGAGVALVMETIFHFFLVRTVSIFDEGGCGAMELWAKKVFCWRTQEIGNSWRRIFLCLFIYEASKAPTNSNDVDFDCCLRSVIGCLIIDSVVNDSCLYGVLWRLPIASIVV